MNPIGHRSLLTLVDVSSVLSDTQVVSASKKKITSEAYMVKERIVLLAAVVGTSISDG